MDNDLKHVTPWGEIGYITFKKSYARKINDDDNSIITEEFEDVVNREIEAIDKQLGLKFTDAEKELYKKTRLELKWSVAGRFMWQLGTKTVKKLGLPSLQNCSFVVVDEPVTPFTWAMDMLMLGSGVGFNIQRENVYKLPKLKSKVKIERKDSKDVDFIVPDNREGWIKLLGKVLKSHFYSGQGFTYSTVCVRSKGAAIKGFGGVASGAEELCEGITAIDEVLNKKANKKLEPVDCLDIMNIIGKIVVSGNVRRSAQLALGDYDDIAYLRAKRWDLDKIPNWRVMSNNSVVSPKNLDSLPKEFWETYEQGEPYGLINLDLSRKCGRVGEHEYPDVDVQGYNPCAEQSLANKETCCLSEIFLPNIKSYQELLSILSLTYRVNKHSLLLPCHLKDTEAIVHKNMRMGIGVTGVLQSTEEQISWLKHAYKWLREYDKEYSLKLNIPTSIKLTTIKPSGTLSLLAGVTPGIHPNPAGHYYIRRIRISSNSPLIEICRKSGYPIEPQFNLDNSTDRNTMVVSFPCRVSEITPVASSFGWREQMDMIRRMQQEWSDNSVSCTVYYKKEDLNDIKEYLKKYFTDEIKTISFLLYQDSGFKQMPYETISKEEYDIMVAKVTPINNFSIKETDVELNVECENGVCPIK